MCLWAAWLDSLESSADPGGGPGCQQARETAPFPCLLSPGDWSLSSLIPITAVRALRWGHVLNKGRESIAGVLGTCSRKSLATPSDMCHLPFPLPPAPCHHEQTVSFHQPSLLSKHQALRGGPAVSGPIGLEPVPSWKGTERGQERGRA